MSTTTSKRRLPYFAVFRDTDGDWRWRLVAANGRVVAVSGEGYKNRAHALKNINAMTFLLAKVNEVYEEGEA